MKSTEELKEIISDFILHLEVMDELNDFAITKEGKFLVEKSVIDFMDKNDWLDSSCFYTLTIDPVFRTYGIKFELKVKPNSLVGYINGFFNVRSSFLIWAEKESNLLAIINAIKISNIIYHSMYRIAADFQLINSGKDIVPFKYKFDKHQEIVINNWERIFLSEKRYIILNKKSSHLAILIDRETELAEVCSINVKEKVFIRTSEYAKSLESKTLAKREFIDDTFELDYDGE